MKQKGQCTIAMLMAVFCLIMTAMPGVASAMQLQDLADTSVAEDGEVSSAQAELHETEAEEPVTAESEEASSEEESPDINSDSTESIEPEEVPMAALEPKPEAAEEGQEEQSDEPQRFDEEPAQGEAQTYTFENNDIKVTAATKSGVLPEGTKLDVVNLSAPRQSDESKKEYQARQNVCSEATDLLDQQLAQDDRSVKDAQAYDIHFLTPDGQEVQPSEDINISMQFKSNMNLTGASNQNNSVQMAHILEQDQQPKQVEQVDADLEVTEDGTVQKADFLARSFSVYLVYTVDFSYVVDGTRFEYSIRGGSAIDLKELLPLLGVVQDNTETEQNEVDIFVENIVDAKFSNESLVKVAQVAEDTTFGQLKTQLNLKPEYSKELTEVQIAAMDAQTITAPSWALISLKAFTSDETLTLTMKHGEVITIQVTDYANEKWEVWCDGTLGQSNQDTKFYTGATNTRYEVTPNQSFTLPNTAGNPYNNNGYYKLNGWYDVKNKKWYAPGATTDPITSDTVFYADWVPATYDKGPATGVATVDTEDTTGFVKTEMFDYNELINAYFCSTPTVTVNPPNPWWSGNPNTHSETWLANNEFAFISWNYNGNPNNSIGMPGNRREASEYRQKNLTQRIYTNNSEKINKLFDNTEIVGKTVVGEGNYLFSYDENSKEYYYDSDRNAATYNQKYKRFYVYDGLEWLRHSDNNNFNNFLPFNDYPNTNNNNVPSENTGATNYWFGMKNTIDFYLPDNFGKNENGGNVVKLDNGTENDMVFKFSGDDDVWVFVDDQLVLDLGGIHDRAGGTIDFTTGEVKTYFGTINEQNTDPVTVSNPILKSLKGGNHKLTVLYLERGSSLSNCAIYFNLLPQPKPVTIEKSLSGLTAEDQEKYQNLEFTYEVWVKKKARKNQTTSFVLYNTPANAKENEKAIYKKQDGTTEKITITNGEVKLKHGESVIIPNLEATDQVYIVEKGLNMAVFNDPEATRTYHETETTPQIEALSLSGSGGSSKDWSTPQTGYTPLEAEVYSFTNKLKECELKVKKEWFDYENHQNNGAGKSVKFTVKARTGTEGNEQVADVYQFNQNGVDREFELNSTTGWNKEFKNLPVTTPEGQQITYTVEEEEVKGYKSVVRYDETTHTWTMKNTQEPPAKIEVKKQWMDTDGTTPLAEHPTSIKYQIYQFSHQHEWGYYDGDHWHEGEWDVDVQPTEETTGHAYQVCKYDKTHKMERDLGKKDHEHVWTIIEHEATCTEDGYKEYRCQDHPEHNYISYYNDNGEKWFPATGHDWGDWTVVVDATCTVPGSRTRECSKCQEKETEIIPALGHTWTEWVIDSQPTTTTKGSRHRECTRCHTQEVDEIEELKNVFPGTTIPLDEIMEWPTQEKYPNRNETPNQNTSLTMSPSGIFEYNGKYYVIYKEITGTTAYSYFNGPTGDAVKNFIVELKGVVTKEDWLVANNDDAKQKVPVGSVYIAPDKKAYVLVKNEYNNRTNPPESDTMTDRWYCCYTPPAGTNSAGTNASTNAAAASANTVMKAAVRRVAGQTEGSESEASNDSQSSGEVDGPVTVTEGEAPNVTLTDLTLNQLLTDLGISETQFNEGQPSATSGNLLTLYKGDGDGTRTLITPTNDSENIWSSGEITVPVADENGNPYTYYVLETDPQGTSDDWDTTYDKNGVQDKGVVTITNKKKIKVSSLTIHKKGRDYQTSPDPALGGVKFTLKKNDGTIIAEQTTSNGPSTENGNTPLGDATFTGLVVGESYELSEEPASGYMGAGPWTVTVENDGSITMKLKDNPSASESVTKIGNNQFEYEVTIYNTKLYDLPSAGGPGTYLYTIFGVAVGSGAVMMLIDEERRQVLWQKLRRKMN